MSIPEAESVLAAGSSVSIYSVYIILGIVVAAGTVASVLSRWFHIFTKGKRARDDEERRVLEAVIGVPPDRFGPGSKGLVTIVSELTDKVGKQDERLTRLERERNGGAGR